MSEKKWVGEQLPSMYELLPDHLYLSAKHPMVSVLYAHAKGPGWDMTETIVKPLIGVDATYFSDKYSCFDSTERLGRIDKAMQFKKSLGNQMLGNSLAIYSDTEETSDSINRYIHVRGAEMPWGWTKPRDSGQHGDGVIPTDSATAFCTQAKNIGGTHLGVPNKRHAHIQIAKFLGEP